MMLIRFICCVFAALLAGASCALVAAERSPAQAQSSDTRQLVEDQFRDWLAATVWPDAQKQGISRETFDHALVTLTLDWSLPELQPPGQVPPRDDQRQAEFQSPGRYFSEAQLTSLSTAGRILLDEWAAVLDRLERRYGVPREILVAIWGRESHFGRVRPKHQALRVLATQAFMGRRRTLYYPELLAVLLILDQDHWPEETLLSSWAGAMGQPQLLPSKFLRYAVDADGDGLRDIWRSVPDSLGSIANYLREHGWKPKRGWGIEVHVPASVSCTLEGPRQGKPLREWAQLGLTRADRTSLLGENSDVTAFLLMPAGRLGPALLVLENFYVLKKYNESDLYALFIGHLADRLRGGSGFLTAWRPTDPMKRGDIWTMQERLQAQGHDVGKLDGLIGFATRTATGQWQARNQRAETCFPDAALIQMIR
ncbi:lytic murein transglycosylase [Microvirga sp. KLBC 81]|uniref:lytic murein transglycosylase n=1 Tax=Microvirga sp. KLBC 81 TaxID=1862707 RepID=UPI000D50993A|nr:lytic murein transglycosylase [Microvirga sp. KLBC 81]PVE20355.1 lytic murein transglycosylase [Microvirga sp. KLBC 81]